MRICLDRIHPVTGPITHRRRPLVICMLLRKSKRVFVAFRIMFSGFPARPIAKDMKVLILIFSLGKLSLPNPVKNGKHLKCSSTGRCGPPSGSHAWPSGEWCGKVAEVAAVFSALKSFSAGGRIHWASPGSQPSLSHNYCLRPRFR